MGRSKSKATMSLDPEIWEQFKRETDSASETVESLIQNYLGTQKNDVADLKAQLKELEAEEKELESDLQEIKNKLSKNRTQQDNIESAIEHRKKEQSRVDQAVQELVSEVPRKGPNGSRDVEDRVHQLTSSRIYHQKLQKVDCDSEELQNKLVQKVKA